MTAIAARRRRRTWSALVAGLVVVVAIPVLGVAGWRAIRDSRAARDVTSRARTIPITPTALLAGVDDRGDLATLAMLTTAPDGSGGSVVEVPVGASITDADGERHRLADRYATGGLEQLRIDVESLLLVSVNLAEEVDEAGLVSLLAPVGDIQVDLPAPAVRGDDVVGAPGTDDAIDDDSPGDDGFDDAGFGDGDDPAPVTSVAGEVIADAGPQTLDAQTAARVLLASVPGQSEVERMPVTAAVWEAIAATVGAGVPGLAPLDPDGGVPESFERLIDALWSGEVLPWQLGATPITSFVDNPTGADLLQTDLAEAIMVVATVAPSAASPVLDGASVMLTSGFADWHVTRDAIGVLAYIGANVVMVENTDDAPPATSVVAAASAGVQPLAAEYAAALGAHDVGEIDDPIEGIEVTIVLGQSFADDRTAAEQGPLESVPSRDTVDQNLLPTTVAGDDAVES